MSPAGLLISIAHLPTLCFLYTILSDSEQFFFSFVLIILVEFDTIELSLIYSELQKKVTFLCDFNLSYSF